MTSSSAIPDPVDTHPSVVLTGLLRRARYEVLCAPGTADEVERYVPRSVPVTVTTAARRGLASTLSLCEDLRERGYSVVPHLTARLVRDLVELEEIVDRLRDAGIHEVFVIAGDAAQSAGRFASALDLLVAGQALPVWRSLRVGVAGYPEGHPHVPATALDEALRAKRPMSSYAVTQMCFDPDAVRAWVAHTRRVGFDRPVYAGVPGAVTALRLTKVATRIGVGPSLRLARKQRGVTSLLGPRGYRPDRLVEAISTTGVEGLHVYTLGAVEATERWRLEALDRLSVVTDG